MDKVKRLGGKYKFNAILSDGMEIILWHINYAMALQEIKEKQYNLISCTQATISSEDVQSYLKQEIKKIKKSKKTDAEKIEVIVDLINNMGR